jgi:hypothetical protein
MKVDVLPAGFETVDRLEADTLVLFVPEDVRPLTGLGGLVDWRLTGRLSRWLSRAWLTGAEGEKVLSPGLEHVAVGRLLAFGVGKAEALDAGRIREAGRAAGRALKEAHAGSVVTAVPGDPTPPLPLEDAAKALVAGLEDGGFEGRVTLVGDPEALGKAFGKPAR